MLIGRLELVGGAVVSPHCASNLGNEKQLKSR